VAELLLKDVTLEWTGILEIGEIGVDWKRAEEVCENYVDAKGNEDYRLPTIRELVPGLFRAHEDHFAFFKFLEVYGAHCTRHIP